MNNDNMHKQLYSRGRCVSVGYHIYDNCIMWQLYQVVLTGSFGKAKNYVVAADMKMTDLGKYSSSYGFLGIAFNMMDSKNYDIAYVRYSDNNLTINVKGGLSQFSPSFFRTFEMYYRKCFAILTLANICIGCHKCRKFGK